MVTFLRKYSTVIKGSFLFVECKTTTTNKMYALNERLCLGFIAITNESSEIEADGKHTYWYILCIKIVFHNL
jgi:hypothetical protein